MANTERIDRRIQELEEKLKQERALLDRLKARKAQTDRKADTRRKILVGAVVAKKAKQDPEFLALLLTWLDAGLTAARDRALFGLADAEPSGGIQAGDKAAAAQNRNTGGQEQKGAGPLANDDNPSDGDRAAL